LTGAAEHTNKKRGDEMGRLACWTVDLHLIRAALFIKKKPVFPVGLIF
jgi:hypothetical protein